MRAFRKGPGLWILVGVSLVICGPLARAHPQGLQAIQAAKLVANNASMDDEMGFAVSISGNRALVGAHLKNTPAGLVSGAAFVFEGQADGTWAQAPMILGSDIHLADQFGCAVAISGDRALVGAVAQDPTMQTTNSGAAYLFERQSGGSWAQVAKLVANDAAPSDMFGIAVALQGDRAVVGSYNDDTPAGSNAGSAYVFERQSGGAWLQVAQLKANDGAGNDFFGFSVALSGDRALVGAFRHNNSTPSDAGAAYVFDRQGDGTWPQVAKLSADDKVAGDQLGYSVALDGDRAIAGAPGDDEGNQNTGSAYVFERQPNGTWLQTAHLLGNSLPNFENKMGTAVAIQGDRALVGAPGVTTGAAAAGATYLFVRQVSGVWTLATKFYPNDPGASDGFGSAVSLDGNLALGGSFSDDDPTAGADAGSAGVFRICDGCAYAYGTGTPGCGGTQTVGATLPPVIGSLAFTFTCDNAPPASLGLGLVTNSQDLAGSDPFSIGVLLHCDFALATEVYSLDFVSSPAGQGLVHAAIPNSPFLVGNHYYACAVWAWSSCPLPPFQLSSSRGFALTLLAP